MKYYELTIYLPQPKRRINWAAVIFYIVTIGAAALWWTLLAKLIG